MPAQVGVCYTEEEAKEMALNIEVTGAPAAASYLPCLVGPIGPWQGCLAMMHRWWLLLRSCCC